jgi:hypothetical protein
MIGVLLWVFKAIIIINNGTFQRHDMELVRMGVFGRHGMIQWLSDT